MVTLSADQIICPKLSFDGFAAFMYVCALCIHECLHLFICITSNQLASLKMTKELKVTKVANTTYCDLVIYKAWKIKML